MLYKRKDENESLCVLRITPDVLNQPRTVIVDRNASSDYARFAPAPDGLGLLAHDAVFPEYWAHPDNAQAFRRKSMKCAEVLVPDRVDPSFIVGAYVSCKESRAALQAGAPGLPMTIDPHLFFQTR